MDTAGGHSRCIEYSLIQSVLTEGEKHANCSRKFEVSKTSSERRGLVVRPPGILTLNARVANRTKVINRRTTKSLEVTRVGKNDQKILMEILSCRHQSQEKKGLERSDVKYTKQTKDNAI